MKYAKKICSYGIFFVSLRQNLKNNRALVAEKIDANNGKANHSYHRCQ